MSAPTLARWRSAAALLAIALGTFALVAFTGTIVRSRAAQATTTEYRRLDSLRHPGQQLVMVYIASARCRWCLSAEMPGYLHTVRDSLSRFAKRRGLAFLTIGVAVDVIGSEGLAYLDRVGPFDQVSAGGSWLNEVALRYVWEGYGAPAATPELFVLQRTITRDRNDGLAVQYAVADQQLLARKNGIVDIAAWVSDGVRLPAARASKPR